MRRETARAITAPPTDGCGPSSAKHDPLPITFEWGNW
jgi:hypothetical protein